MERVDGIVLAAGQGKRMRTELPKVAHPLMGRPMILWSIEVLRQAGLQRAVAVVSPRQTLVHQIISEYADAHLDFMLRQALQNHPLGTGDAARHGYVGLLHDNVHDPIDGRTLLVVTGDTPLLRSSTIQSFVSFHKSGRHAVSVLAFESPRPHGYGRVLRDKGGQFVAIREEKDCSDEERAVNLCNSGIMCIETTEAEILFARISKNNAAGEYYLTDVPGHARELLTAKYEHPVGVCHVGDAAEFEGVNTQEQLASAAAVLRRRLIADHMARGVRFEAPDLAYVEPSITFGDDVVVEAFVCLRGQEHVPSGSRLRSGTGMLLCPNLSFEAQADRR